MLFILTFFPTLHFLSWIYFTLWYTVKNLCGSALSTLSTTTIQFETYATKKWMNKRTHFLRVNLMRQPFYEIKFNLFETTLGANSPFFEICSKSFSCDAINILYVPFFFRCVGDKLHLLLHIMWKILYEIYIMNRES